MPKLLLSKFSELKQEVWFCRSSLEVLLGQLESAWVLLEHKHCLVDAAMAQQVCIALFGSWNFECTPEDAACKKTQQM